MNNATFYMIFIALCIAFYLPPLWAKFACSGKTYNHTVFCAVMTYNTFFVYVHWRFAETGNLPFAGAHEKTVMGWVSLFMLFAYGYAIPSEHESQRRLKKIK